MGTSTLLCSGASMPCVKASKDMGEGGVGRWKGRWKVWAKPLPVAKGCLHLVCVARLPIPPC